MDAYEHPPDLDPEADEHGASGIVMSGSDLARILGVGTSSLSQSARNGWQCRGYRVAEWAQWDGDRIAAYDVPAAVVDELTDPDGPTFAESAPAHAPRSEPRRLSSGREPRGFAPSASPAWPEALASAPAGWPDHPHVQPHVLSHPLGVEQIAGELRRVIEEMHKQAERRNEEFERTRQALREDNDRLRDDLRRVQDQHAKEIREAERQLARVKEQAFEKRFELRERLLEAQTEARLAEGGVEDSWLERLVERHGEGLASIVGGVAAAFAGRLAAPPDDWADDDPDRMEDGEPDETGPEPLPFTPRLGGESAPPNSLQPPDARQLESQAEMASRLAALVTDGSPGDIAAVVSELRGQLDAAGAARLAAEVVPLLVSSDAAAVAARLRPAVAATFPLALHLPPATAVMMAREAGVAAGEAEAAWLQRVLSELQAPASDLPSGSPASDPA